MRTISLANQKGGSGKTNSTRAVATWFHYYTDFRVMVIDLDFQQTCSNEREKDLRALNFQRQYNENDRKVLLFDEKEKEIPIYPIFGIPDIKNNLQQFYEIYQREKENYDILFIDVPGNMGGSSVEAILDYINFIYIPTDVDFGTIESSITFATALNTLLKRKELPNLIDIKFFFNKYTLNKNKGLFPEVSALMSEETGIPFFENSIKDTNEMKLDNSTVYPIKGSNTEEHYLYKFCSELFESIK